MKKSILTSLCLALALSLFAADTTRLKPVRGTFTTQVGLSLATLNDNITSLGLNGRYFLKERLALRATVLLLTEKDEQHSTEFADGTGGSGKFTTTMQTTIFMVGVEKHFKGTRRLSPYIGVEAGYGLGSLKTAGENSSGQNFIADYSENEARKLAQINLGAFLGFDYWIADGIYLGIEYSFVGYFSSKVARSDRNMTNSGITTHRVTPESKSSGMTTVNALPMFRLGWKF